MESGSEAMKDYNGFMSKYDGNFRTFGHGAIHVIVTRLFFL